MRRGDLVTIAVSGDYGKPRPAVVMQDDVLAELPSVTVLPITSDVHEEHAIRITVEPDDSVVGLRKPSQIMVDRAVTVPRGKVGTPYSAGWITAPCRSSTSPWRGSPTGESGMTIDDGEDIEAEPGGAG